MDWERVGQAFSGGANVLAGGLMDKYQRQKDLQDWEQKQRLASEIQSGERAQEHAFQFRKQTRDFTLEGIKNDLKTNPELIPYALKAEQGDEEATRILSIYAGAKYQMDQKTPLTSDDLALLKDLPPQTRHVIINRHLTTLNEEVKRKADLEGTLARTEREKATTAKVREDAQANSGLYGDYAIESKARAKAEAEKKKAIADTQKEIQTLSSQANRAGGYLEGDPESERIQQRLQAAQDRLYQLTVSDVVASSAEQARQKWATEGATKAPAPQGKSIPPDVLAAAKKKYPNMPEEEIIRQWQASHK
jgi:hypothetical protein